MSAHIKDCIRTTNQTITGGAGLTAVSFDTGSMSLSPGTWLVDVDSQYTMTTTTGANTTRLTFSGTLTSTTYWFELMSSAAGFVVAFNQTAVATDLGSSTNAGPMRIRYSGLFVVSAVGTLGLSYTRATGGNTTVLPGTRIKARRIF